MSISTLVGAELRIVMFAGFRRRDKISFLAEIVGAAHTNETAFRQIVFLFRSQRDGVDQHGQVVRVAAHHLNKLVLAFDQCLVIDTPGVFLTKAVLAALGDEAAAVVGVFVIDLFFVLIAYR